MYNRYRPQPDGSYQKNTFQDKAPPPKQSSLPPPLNNQNLAPPSKPADHPPSNQAPPPIIENSIPTFLKRLLPKDMDTGDLFIILLLLLMAGDNQEHKTHSILTLALYFLM